MARIKATKILINGLVQGVGFRPTVSKIARSLGLNGWVKNTPFGVEVVVATLDINDFIEQLECCLPKLASLDNIVTELVDITSVSDFQIIDSDLLATNSTIISPDNYVCQDCLQDIFDKNSRYFLYPFTNCTNCGPRYTVINDLPYDRSKTTLAPFTMCQDCLTAYRDIDNRRYHAQASSCNTCGPQLDTQLADVTNLIKAGQIIAIKSVGAYLLIADATNYTAIAKLRERKRRLFKPFAVMCLNIGSIRRSVASVSSHAEGLLESSATPIVLLDQLKSTVISANVAPNLTTIGVMLPSSPIHYLLFYYLLGCPEGHDWLNEATDIVLIATSANLSGNSIIAKNSEAQEQLADIADFMVHYNRDIAIKVDDSVMLSVNNYDVLLRRARGFVPKPYYFRYNFPEVLGVGAELKVTFTFIRDNKAFLSQYLGDMDSISNIDYYLQVYQHYKKIYHFSPQLVVSDLHPDFYTTQFAESLGIQHIKIQHHIAHFASVLANVESYNQTIDLKVLGCILDGYGYGANGEALGGELIEFNKQEFSFTTISQLLPILVPGGDKAEQEPWRLAVGLCIDNNLPLPPHLLAIPQVHQLVDLIKRNQFARSNACGRYFSAVAALLDIVQLVTYEAQAALVLESLVTTPEINYDIVRLTEDGRPDINILFQHIYQIGIIQDDKPKAINVFYGSFVALIEKWIVFHCSLRGVKQVAISGGCWQSKYLLAGLHDKLKSFGIKLLTPYQLPFNDEAISFGQAWYGAQMIINNKLLNN